MWVCNLVPVMARRGLPPSVDVMVLIFSLFTDISKFAATYAKDIVIKGGDINVDNNDKVTSDNTAPLYQ